MPDGSRSRPRQVAVHFDRTFASWVHHWPWSRRSLILFLRIAASLCATVVLVLTWYAVAWLPWPIDGLLAVAACFAFAYWFERGAGR